MLESIDGRLAGSFEFREVGAEDKSTPASMNSIVVDHWPKQTRGVKLEVGIQARVLVKMNFCAVSAYPSYGIG